MLERLVRQGGAYAIAGALLKAAGLVLAPLLLNPEYLPVEDYGSLALLMVTAQLAILTAGLGLSTALLRFMTRPDENREGLPLAALLLSVLSAGASAVIFAVFAEPLARLLTDSAGNAGLLMPLSVYVAAKCISAIPLTLLRVRERAGLYTVAVVAEMIVLIAIAYFELVGRGTGLPGLLRAYAGSAVAGLVLMLVLTAPGTRLRVDRKAFLPLLKFGLPLVLASLSGWFMNAGDRYILGWLADREAVAAYEWSARLAGLINLLLVQSFQLAFTVVGLKAIAGGAADFYRRTMRHFVIWTGAAILVLSVWTPEGMRVLIRLFDVDPHYLQASTLVFPLALGFGAHGIYIIVNNALLASGRTGIIGANILGVATLNALLNIGLIPYVGALGAALATTFSYAALAAVAAWTSRRDLKVRYPWRVPLVVTVLLIVLFAAATWVDVTLGPGWRSLTKVGITALYFMAIPIAGFYTWEDWAAVRRRIRAMSGSEPGPAAKQAPEERH